uniref:Uncharacterized protein n=1 Tax=Leptobrachium leishanense TaxID=445787 RepID=A0A8C5MZU4_9ANUR
MRRVACFLLLLLLLGLLVLVLGDPSGCIKVNPCKCLMKDGSGVVDLASLGDSDGFLMMDKKIVREAGGGETEQSVTFSPCHPFSEPEDAGNCTRVVLSVKTRDLVTPGSASRCVGFGQQNDNEFNYSNESRSLSVTYQALTDRSISAIVHFNCSPSSSVTFPVNPQDPGMVEILIQSPCVCPSSCQTDDVGPGTVILILFAASTAFYFLFGTCGLRSIRTAEGTQIAPEPHIWCWICFLCSREKETWGSLEESDCREDLSV